jgi:uncharacterized protein YggE
MPRFRTVFALGAATISAVIAIGCSGGGDTYVTSGGPSEGISVTGEGKVSGAPDIATVRLGVRVEAASVEEARNQAAELQQAIIDSVKANGISDDDAQTSNFNIQPVYGGDPNRTIRAYQVTNTLAIEIKKLATVSKVIDDAARAGGNSVTIQGLQFGIEDPERLREEARKLAMEQAKKRAEETARNAGVNLGKPISISEGFSGGVYDQVGIPAPRTGSGLASDTPIQSGRLDVIVNVQVVYRID